MTRSRSQGRDRPTTSAAALAALSKRSVVITDAQQKSNTNNENQHSNNNNNNNNNNNQQQQQQQQQHQQQQQQQPQLPFYISPKLFQNKRLRERRAKYKQLTTLIAQSATVNKTITATAAAAAAAAAVTSARIFQRKTEKCKLISQTINKCAITETIDLLSDDENQKQLPTTVNTIVSNGFSMPIYYNNNNTAINQELLQYPDCTTVATAPTVEQLRCYQLQLEELIKPHKIVRPQFITKKCSSISTNSSSSQRKRRTQKSSMKSSKILHSNSIGLINDCIVIDDSDDNDDDDNDGGGGGGGEGDDDNSDLAKNDKTMHTLLGADSVPLSKLHAICNADVTLIQAPMMKDNNRIQQPPPLSVMPALNHTISSPNLTEYDDTEDEVTVTLVPKNTGECTASIKPSPFPMQPDETTVQTVIANRLYELSLAKLREGLASSGVADFRQNSPTATTVGGQNTININANVSPIRRKGYLKQPIAVNTQIEPISLKLSTDLSISLISDDEDDAEMQFNETMYAPEHLMRNNPQLQVKKLAFNSQPTSPAQNCSTNCSPNSMNSIKLISPHALTSSPIPIKYSGHCSMTSPTISIANQHHHLHHHLHHHHHHQQQHHQPNSRLNAIEIHHKK